MKMRALANTGLELSSIGLGEMPLSLSTRPSEEHALSVIRGAMEAGMTWIDTADVYCADHRDIGHGERLAAKALKEIGDDGKGIVVATKGGLERPNGDWVCNGQPSHLRKACEASLRALEVDCLTWYQLHAPDEKVPFSDSVGELSRLKEEGKIQHLGLSNVRVSEIELAREITEIISVQNRCNPFDRNSFDNGVVSYCHQENIAFLAHSPVGGHHGHVRTPEDPALSAVAQRMNISAYQVCLAWLLALSPVIFPIPGASRLESARSSASAADIELGDIDLAELNLAFPVRV